MGYWLRAHSGSRNNCLISTALEKGKKKNAILFLLFCYKVFVQWKLKLLNIVMDSVQGRSWKAEKRQDQRPLPVPPGCDVKLFCFSRANHASRNLKRFLSWKLDKFALFTHLLVGYNLENLYKHAVSIFFFCLSWHFTCKREKSVFSKASFLKNKNWLLEQDFVYKQRLPFVRKFR